MANLKNIKSKLILKRIFNNISYLKKLLLVIYNKNLQNIISIDIENYKRKSGKLKLLEKNGKGKEYLLYGTKELIFEGEYLNGLRHGKGQVYFTNGNIRYIGEYLKGKFNGYIKEYTLRGHLLFEGEYLNGKRNGKGKKYDKNFGCLLFEGEYLNGKRNGQGKEYDRYDGRLRFEGEYLNGKRNGNGTFFNKIGISYIGKYKDGKRI